MWPVILHILKSEYTKRAACSWILHSKTDGNQPYLEWALKLPHCLSPSVWMSAASASKTLCVISAWLPSKCCTNTVKCANFLLLHVTTVDYFAGTWTTRIATLLPIFLCHSITFCPFTSLMSFVFYFYCATRLPLVQHFSLVKADDIALLLASVRPGG